MALVLLFTALTPRMYTTTATLIAGNPGGDASGNAGGNTTIPVLNALLAASHVQTGESYITLLQLPSVARQVTSDLRLSTTPSALLKHLQVLPITNTSMFHLSATWSDPRTSARIANRFASVFTNRERQLVTGQATEALGFLGTEMRASEESMRRSEARLAQYKMRHSIADVQVQTQSIIGALTALDQRIDDVEGDYRKSEAQLSTDSAQLGSISPSVTGTSNTAPNPVLAQLRTQLAATEVQLETDSERFTPNHPEIGMLRAQEAVLKHAIASQPEMISAGGAVVPNQLYQQIQSQVSSLRSQVAGDLANLSSLHKNRAALQVTLHRFPVESRTLADLDREAKTNEALYAAFQQKYNDALISKSTSLSDVSVVDPANEGDAVVRPDWRLTLPLGLALGVFLALASAFVVDYFDATFKDEKDVARELALPVLSSIPALPPTNGKSPATLRAISVEAFVQLLVSLRYSSEDALRTIAVTSPFEGDGKSTIALNMAVMMAGVQPKVLLVDGDLRRPSLHARIGFSNVRGFSDALIGAYSLSDVIRRTRYSGLDFLSAGPPAPSPFKLYQSSRFKELVREMLATYQVVIFDTPSLVLSDAAVLASKVEGTVLVVSTGSTDVRATTRTVARLQSVGGITLLGVVLNRAPMSAAGKLYSGYDIDLVPQLPLAAGPSTGKPTK